MLTFFEDFEAAELPPESRVSKDSKLGDLAVVETESAHSGQRALRLLDTPGQQHRYFPMLVVSPAHSGGSSCCRFAIRLSEHAVFQHEWRDNASPYRIGPSIWIENGQLRAGNKALLELPIDRWIEIEVSAALGEAAGTWDLSVTLPGTEPEQFKGLPIHNPDWQNLEWLGFVSQADTDSEIWIDDLELTRP